MNSSTKGRKPLAISDEQRTAARELAARGVERTVIAATIGVSVPTLRKRFADELSVQVLSGDADPASLQLFSAEAVPVVPSPPTAARQQIAGHRQKGGRKEFRPTDEQRRLVALYAATNTKEADIAAALGISEPTLRKHFREELKTTALRKRGEALVLLERAARKGNVAAQKELLARLDQALLEEADAKLRDYGADQREAVRPVETPGKKAQDAQDAIDIAESDEWRSLLRPSQERTKGSSKLN